MFKFLQRRWPRQTSPSKPRGLLKRALLTGFGGVFDAASLVLCVAVVGTSSIIFLVGEGIEIPVPSHFIHHYAKALESQGLGVSCGRLSFDLTGGIRAENIRITGMNGMDILRIRQAYTHISPENVMGRVPEFDVLVIDDATILLPAYISDTGEESPVLSHVFTKLDLSHSKIHVEYLQGMVGKLTASSTNAFDIDLRKLRAEAGKTAAADTRLFAARIASRLAVAGRAERYIDVLDGPSVSISPATDLSSAHVRLLAKSATYDDATAQNIDVELAADRSLNLTQARIRTDDVNGRGASLNGVQIVVDTPVRIPTSADALKNASAKAHLYVANASYRGETVHGVDLFIDRRPGETAFDASFVFDDLPVSLNANVRDDRTVTADFELLARLDTAIRIGKLPADKIVPRFYSKAPFRIVGYASVPQKLSEARLDFDIWGRDMNARGMPIENAYVRGAIGRDILFCSDVQLTSNGSRVNGTFRQDVRTLDWRMCLKGTIYPPDLGPVLGRWWYPIWEDFKFDGPRVNADLDLSGNWKERHYANIVGTVDMKRLLYNGVRIEKGSLDLRTGKGYVDIYNLVAKTDAGALSGRIAWLLRIDDTMDVTFRFNSDLPADKLDKAFGSVMTDQIPDWVFSKPPSVKMAGNLEKLAPGKWKNDIYADAHAENGSWRGIHFDTLDVSVWNNRERTLIKIKNATILGGALSGLVAQNHENADRMLAMDLTLADTDLTPTLQALQSLGNKKHEEPAQARIGRVNMHYEGFASTSDISGTIVGRGDFQIHHADLAKIKVFGALSSLMSSIGKGFGTFTIDSISSDFTTQKGVARLKHTVLAGPAAKVEAKGTIGLNDKSLNFDAKVFLLTTDKASLMNIFGTILTPFGYIMELSLKGTFDDPSWRFKIDPRNIFDNGNPASGAKPAASGDAKTVKPAKVK
jgi:hypothetical protein